MDNENTVITEQSQPDTATAEKAPRFPRLAKLWEEYGYLTAAFLIPALLMWLIYIAMEVYPFGESSVLVLDLNGQYVYFFEALRNIVREGGSFLYSFSRSLGGEFMGIYAYYLASPFSFITALFPDGMITESLLVMFLLKCGLCGATFGFYIHKTRPNANRIATVFFSMMYALCSYGIVQQHNTMWIDNMIFLPLVALGVENIIRYGKYKMFIIFLSMSVLSNFYIGYMMCIFVAAYFFYFWAAHSEDGENNPLRERKHFLRSFIRIAVYSIIGVGISAVIILTAYYALTFGKTTFSNPTYTFSQQYDFLDIVTKLFPGSYDTVRPEGLPFIYCGVFGLVMLPLYFLCPKFSAKERIATAVLLLFFVMSFNTQVIDMVWHGFQRPNWLNCRYSFMFCFVLLVAAEKAYEHIKEFKFSTVFGVCAFLAALLLVIQKLDYESMPDIDAIWLSLACVAVYLIATHSAMRSIFVNQSAMIILVLVCLELFAAGLLNVIALDNDVVISSRTSYVSYMDHWKPAFDKLENYDSSFYRSEKTEHRKTNDAMTIGNYGLTNSTSTLNRSTIDFLAKMGYSSKSHWSKYLGGTPVSDSILGIKYILSEDAISDLYDTAFTVEPEEGSDERAITAYYNRYALSLATAVSSNLNTIVPEDYYNPFDYMNALVTEMLGRDQTVELFVPLRLTAMSDDNVTISYVTDHKKYTADGTSGDPKVTFTFASPEKAVQIYAYFATTYPRECKMQVNGVANGTYFGNETMRIVNIGKKGSIVASDTPEITITMTLQEDVLYLANDSSYYLYYLDEELFAEIMPELARYSYNIDEDYSEDHFTGTITTTADRPTVFTSIPYDEGWQVYVDGKKVEIYESIDALIAFNVFEPGEHTLELRYMPKAFVLGAIISVVSVIAFAALWFFDEFLRAKRKKAIAIEGADTAVLDGVTVFPFPIKDTMPEDVETADEQTETEIKTETEN